MRAPYLNDGDVRLYLGDCIEVMREMDAESVDAVVCDPPYGLEFMGKEWDSFGNTYAGGNPNMKPAAAVVGDRGEVGVSYGYRAKNPRCTRCGKLQRGNGSCKCPEPRWDTRTSESAFTFQAWCETWAREALRVLKPGGHMLAFGGTRTFHRLTCGIEDAGFEVRDCLSWNYASGFPKSLDVSKAIDKATDAAREWQGWGTALKPAFEPVVVGLKPHTAQSALAVESLHAKEELCAVVSCDAMDTSWSELLRTSGLSSIASSLLGCLDDLSQRASTFTTETASSLTTDLRIWRSCLSPITLATTTPARTLPPGASSYARDAAALSVSVLHKCERLAATTAGATAIAPPVVPALTPEFDPSNARPAWEPCVIARKPLAGTVAVNVQEHGTGALNIDGCRIGRDPDDVSGWAATGSKAGPNRAMSGANTSRAPKPDAAGRWPANVAFDEAAAAMLDAQSGERPGFSGGGENGAGFRGQYVGGEKHARTIEANPYKDTGGASRFFYTAKASRADRNAGGMAENTHPTVKPTDLMRWLVRLVTPPGGVVLDPFAGSGSTLVAARSEGFRAIGIEREEEYARIIADRLSQLSLFSEAS